MQSITGRRAGTEAEDDHATLISFIPLILVAPDACLPKIYCPSSHSRHFLLPPPPAQVPIPII